MKTKVLSLIAIAGIVALSFAFTPSKNVKKATKETVLKSRDAEPLGGLLSEGKF
jgi:hypothetical protein